MTDEIFEPYAIAETLLRDKNLVWHNDFDSIREALAAVMHECPNHGGAFDCTPFCSLCEGKQEVVSK